MNKTTEKRLGQIESRVAEMQRESDPANEPLMQLSPDDQALVRRKIEADGHGESIEETPEFIAAYRRYLFVLRDREIEAEKRMTPEQRKELWDRRIALLHEGRNRCARRQGLPQTRTTSSGASGRSVSQHLLLGRGQTCY